MTKITLNSITLRLLPLKLTHPFTSANDTIHYKNTLLLETNYQNEAIFSECVALPFAGYTAESIHTAQHCLIKTLIPAILNKPFLNPTEVSPFLDKLIDDNEMAKAAIEMLYWQLAAIQSKQSLASYIGGVHQHIPVGLCHWHSKNDQETLLKINQH